MKNVNNENYYREAIKGKAWESNSETLMNVLGNVWRFVNNLLTKVKNNLYITFDEVWENINSFNNILFTFLLFLENENKYFTTLNRNK